MDQRHDNFAVFSILTRLTNHQIPFQDSGAFHRVPLYPKGEQVGTPVHGRINHHTAVPLLLSVQWQTGGNLPDDRHFCPAHDPRRFSGPIQQMDGAAVASLTLDSPFLLKGFDQLGYRGVAYAHIGCRLSQAGGFSGSGDFALQVPEKSLLFWR